MTETGEIPDAEELASSFQQVLNRRKPKEGTAESQRTESDTATAAPPPVARIIEALLFVGGEPLPGGFASVHDVCQVAKY